MRHFTSQLQSSAIQQPETRLLVKRQQTVTKQLRSRLPMTPGFTLAASSDSGILGDAKTREANVDLLGLTSPNAAVTLTTPLAAISATADAAGRFLFTNIPLALGQTPFTVTAENRVGKRRFTTRFERVAADSTDAVLDWNATLLRTVQLTRTGGLQAARTLAITHVAIYDAVNALIGDQRSYRPIPVAVPATAAAAAAAAGAAYQVLAQLYPAQQSRLDSELAVSLAKIQESEAAEQSGLAFGKAVANGILSERSQDGAANSASYSAPLKPGKWRPTPPNFSPAVGVAWHQVEPFVLQQSAQFRPVAPPRLTSSTYATDLNQVKAVGQIDSRSRTAEQTAITRFWIGSSGTSTAPGMWNEIAARAAQADQLLQNAQLFAELNLALADASIAAWDTKYTYRSWRPVTAIRLAGSDRNSATRADPDWQSFLETPAHPDYVAAHSTYAGAAAAVLTRRFGAAYRLKVTSFDLPGIERSFRSFDEAAAEAGVSRIYGGIHTMSANREGLKLGRKVGNYVLQRFG